MRLRTKFVVSGLAAATVLGSGLGAYAYFTGSGSGTGQASVGSAGTWSVTAGSASGTMYPGAGTSTVTYTATNNATGAQGIDSASQIAAAVLTVGGTGANQGDITSSGADVPGCLASWFNAPTLGATTPAYGTSVAAGGTYTIPVSLTMKDSGTNQDACKGAAPDVKVSVSHS